MNVCTNLILRHFPLIPSHNAKSLYYSLLCMAVVHSLRHPCPLSSHSGILVFGQLVLSQYLLHAAGRCASRLDHRWLLSSNIDIMRRRVLWIQSWLPCCSVLINQRDCALIQCLSILNPPSITNCVLSANSFHYQLYFQPVRVNLPGAVMLWALICLCVCISCMISMISTHCRCCRAWARSQLTGRDSRG